MSLVNYINDMQLHFKDSQNKFRYLDSYCNKSNVNCNLIKKGLKDYLGELPNVLYNQAHPQMHYLWEFLVNNVSLDIFTENYLDPEDWNQSFPIMREGIVD